MKNDLYAPGELNAGPPIPTCITSKLFVNGRLTAAGVAFREAMERAKAAGRIRTQPQPPLHREHGKRDLMRYIAT